MKINHPYITIRSAASLMVLCILLFSSSCKTTQSGDKSTSGKSASEMSNKDKVTFDMLFFDANKEKILGNLDKAEVAFLEALKISPNNGAALYELANIYFYKKDKVKSLLYSKKAVAIDPSNEWFQLLYVDCLKQNKQSKEVAEVYETLIEKNPTKIEYYYELANSYLMSNKINDALKAYDKIEARFGVTEEASMQKLTIFNSLKSFDKSVAEVQKLIKAFPKEAKYYGMLGELYQSNGMNDKALQAFTDLLKIDSTNAFVHLSLADFYRNTKQNDKAFEEIKIAFKSNELDIDPKIKILLSYYEITEKFPELKPDAFKLCDILIGVHPNEAKAFAMYGDFLFRDKKLSDAREKYRKAISIDKGKYALWENLLIIDSDLNDVPSLSQESKEAMDLFPNQPLPYLFFADSNIKLKNYKEAIDALNEGKEFVIDNKILTAQFYTLIGDAQNSLKNFPASDNAYDKALELDPNNISVLNNYAYFLSLRKTNLEKAGAMSKKCNDLEPNNNSYLDTYGWILYQQSKYDDAKVWIGKALDNGGRNNGTLLEHYGDVLFKLGETENAVKYWMDAKKVGGTSDFIDKKIADKKLYE